jgi:hypothetical protein
MIPLINFNMFGAISCDNDKKGALDGYYLVRFTNIPFVLQEPSPVEGCNSGDMPEGTTVVKGRYWHRVPQSPHWFQEGKWDDPKLLFCIQYVLDPNIEMEAYHQRDGNLPATNSLTAEQRRRAPTKCKKVPDSVVEDIAGLRKKEGINWTMLSWNSRTIQAMMRMTWRMIMRRRKKRRRNSSYM